MALLFHISIAGLPGRARGSAARLGHADRSASVRSIRTELFVTGYFRIPVEFFVLSFYLVSHMDIHVYTSSELARPLALDLTHLHVAHFDFPAAAPAETFEESLARVCTGHSSQHRPAHLRLGPTRQPTTRSRQRTIARLVA